MLDIAATAPAAHIILKKIYIYLFKPQREGKQARQVLFITSESIRVVENMKAQATSLCGEPSIWTE